MGHRVRIHEAAVDVGAVGLRVAAGTHRGYLRRRNEDAIAVLPDSRLFALADGVGGGPDGDRASLLALEACARFARAARDRRPADRLAAAATAAELAWAAHTRVCEAPPAPGERPGMATTLTAAWGLAEGLAVVGVGDSRAYRLRGGRIMRLCGAPRRRHEAWIGFRDVIRPSVDVHKYRLGDRYLLCSDGLFGYVEFPRWRHRLAEGLTPADVVDACIAEALQAGAPDNVAVVVVDVGEPGAVARATDAGDGRAVLVPGNGVAPGRILKLRLGGRGLLAVSEARRWGGLDNFLLVAAAGAARGAVEFGGFNVGAKAFAAASARPGQDHYVAVDARTADELQAASVELGLDVGVWVSELLERGVFPAESGHAALSR